HPPTSRPHPRSLHDALPICFRSLVRAGVGQEGADFRGDRDASGQGEVDAAEEGRIIGPRRRGDVMGLKLGTYQTVDFASQRYGIDRKSTRLNSSHRTISYAV